MKDNKIAILSTRLLDDSQLEKAAYNGIAIETISFIQVEKQVSDKVAARIQALSGESIAVVFTSMNALEIVVELLPVCPLMPDWKIYCMGGATFTLVKKYWPYENIVFTGKNATEIAERIIADKVNDIKFFCGAQRREELPMLLAENQLRVEELAVYRTIETPSKVVNNYAGILFFSPSAVHSYFSHNHPGIETTFFALGHTTANAIKRYTTNHIVVSDFPAKDQLVDKVIGYYGERASSES